MKTRDEKVRRVVRDCCNSDLFAAMNCRVLMSLSVFQACCAQELFGILKIGFKILFVVCGETVTRFQIIGIAELSPEQAAGVRQIIYKTI